jgi:FlaA1/EpsC-like NDP-sugar epimerase
MARKIACKWLVLGIDLSMIVVSFVLAYIIRFNFSLNFDVSVLAFQLPVVALIAFMAFRITGSYKGVLGYASNRDVYNIFKAVILSGVLIILLVIINSSLGIYPDFSIPLSIIIIYSFLSFIGLAGSHYVFRLVFNGMVPSNE